MKLRSSRSQMFYRIGVSKSFVNFTGKQLCWHLFLIKLQTLLDTHDVVSTSIQVVRYRATSYRRLNNVMCLPSPVAAGNFIRMSVFADLFIPSKFILITRFLRVFQCFLLFYMIPVCTWDSCFLLLIDSSLFPHT